MRRRAATAFLMCGLGVACAGPAAGPPSRLVIAYPSGPLALTGQALDEEYAISILGNVFEPLVDLDRDLALRPGLAETWYTPDDLTWVFRLRRGTRLHDGRVLTASHVAESLERTRSDPGSRRQGELTAVQSVEAVDAETLVLRTRRPYGPLPGRLANVFVSVPAAEVEAPDVGTGPYRVRSWSPGRLIVLEAFPGHHAGPPPIELLEFHVVPSATRRVQLLRDGGVHLVADVPSEDFAELGRDSRFRTLTSQGMRVVYLGMDCARERNPHVTAPVNPFRDSRVRRAVSHAVDRVALVREALGGHGEPTDQLVVPEVFGHHSALRPRAFDPEAARRLLAAAGHAGGFRVDLDLIPDRYRGTQAVVEAVSADLARAGIQIAPRPSSVADFVSRLNRRDTALFLIGTLSTTGDAVRTYDAILHTPGQGYGSVNGGGYSEPELDRLLREATGQLRSDQRARLLYRVAEQVHEDVPVVPLYRQADLYAVARDLEFRPRLNRLLKAAELRWSPR